MTVQHVQIMLRRKLDKKKLRVTGPLSYLASTYALAACLNKLQR